MKRLFSIALVAAVLAGFSAAPLAPERTVRAAGTPESVSALLAMIRELQEKVKVLQAELARRRGAAALAETVLPVRPTIVAGRDPASPPPREVTAASQGITLAVFRLTEGSLREELAIQSVAVEDRVKDNRAVLPSFARVTLYAGPRMIAVAEGAAPVSAEAYRYSFTVPPGALSLPAGGSLSLTVKADIAPSFTDASAHRIALVSGAGGTPPIAAVGLASGLPAEVNVLPSAAGGTVTILRTTLAVKTAPLGVLLGRPKDAFDELATISVSADAAGAAVLNKITITWEGDALSLATSTPPPVVAGARLVNLVTNLPLLPTSSACGKARPLRCTTTWEFGSGTSGLVVNGGWRTDFRLRVSSALIPDAGSPGIQTLSARIAAGSGVSYTDGTSGNAVSGLPLASSSTPLLVTEVRYGALAAAAGAIFENARTLFEQAWGPNR